MQCHRHEATLPFETLWEAAWELFEDSWVTLEGSGMNNRKNILILILLRFFLT